MKVKEYLARVDKKDLNHLRFWVSYKRRGVEEYKENLIFTEIKDNKEILESEIHSIQHEDWTTNIFIKIKI